MAKVLEDLSNAGVAIWLDDLSRGEVSQRFSKTVNQGIQRSWSYN